MNKIIFSAIDNSNLKQVKKIIKDTYDKCLLSKEQSDYKKNHVKNIYKGNFLHVLWKYF